MPQTRAVDASDGEWSNLLVPGARSGHTAVYDPVRDRMLVFGGFDGGLPSDVWALTLSGTPSWNKLNALGIPPGGRNRATAVYDPVRDRVVMFGGGAAGGYSNDVWVLTLAGTPTWSQLTPTGAPPSQRSGHTAIYDPIRDRMIVFAGAGTVYTNDLWALSFSGTPTWTQLSPTGTAPNPRVGHTAIYDPIRDRMVVLGGFDGGPTQSVVWALSLSGTPTWSQLAPAGTSSRGWDWHAAVYDPSGDRMVAFAGLNGSVFSNDVWALSLAGATSWSQLAPAGGPPNARDQHTAIYDPLRGRMIVFAGLDDGVFEGDTWALTLGGATDWSPLVPIDPPPPGRHGHSAILDVGGDRLVTFGGLADGLLNDVWALAMDTPSTWSQLAPAGVPPSARTWHSAIYDPEGERMLVFGGADIGPLQDVWALTLSGTPMWNALSPAGSPPPARYQHTAIYDPVRDRMIVFGGLGASSALNDVWALTLSGTPAWSQLAPNGTPPSARYGHTAIYDPVRDRMLVFGGSDAGGGVHNDLWELTLSGTPAWNPLTPAGPLPYSRSGHTAVYDAARDRMLVFGGAWQPSGPQPYFNDTWSLSLSGTPTWVASSPGGTAPGVRSEHAAFFDPSRDRMVVFAGLEERHAYYNDARSLSFGGITGVGPGPTSASISLAPGRPNPSRGEVTIPFALPRPTHVTLRVYDAAGRVVRTLVEGVLPTGNHVARWEGRTARGMAVTSGVYLLELEAEDRRLMRRLVIIR